MKRLTVSEYAREYNLSESAVRKQLRSGKLAFTKEIINNREIMLILIGDKTGSATPGAVPYDDENYQGTIPEYQSTVHGKVPYTNQSESIHDAEIINESRSYNLVSMENTTFEQLIESIKELAEKQVVSEKESYKKLETEFFELKAANKKLIEQIENLKDKIYNEKINSAQVEAELKIKEMRLQELEKHSQGWLNKL